MPCCSVLEQMLPTLVPEMQSMIVSGGSGGGPGFGGGGPGGGGGHRGNINVMLTPEGRAEAVQRADRDGSSAGSCLDCRRHHPGERRGRQ